MKFRLIIALIPFSIITYSQVVEYAPSSVQPIDFNEKEETEFNKNLKACEIIWDKLSKGVTYEELTEDEKVALTKVDETKQDYWAAIGDGCSWYCGGGPKNVSASSFLKTQGSYSYEPQNAHDLNYKNAWAEGVPGYGIGEYLVYTFSGDSPRITEILIANGYVKSQSAWENNSRVKKLKVYINDEPFAILHLDDIRGVQSFFVDPIGTHDRENIEVLKRQPDWTLKFEILEVYKGLKYDDVVISEIFFDGIDVH